MAEAAGKPEEEETVEQLREKLNAEETAHEATRTELSQALEEERAAHKATREQLEHAQVRRAPKCSGCRRRATHGRDVTSAMSSAPQNGDAGVPQPRHMTPCVCHCAACRAAGHGDGACVVLCAGLHALFDGKADVVDLVFENYYGACGWGTVRFDADIHCVQYGPAGDVIAAGSFDGRIYFRV